MTFSDAVSAFSTSLPGTDAYVKLRHSMQTLIKHDPCHAAVYFLIFGFARTYVMLYEDQEVSPQFAEENQATMVSYLTSLEYALNQNQPAELYAMLNEVVNRYEKSKKAF